MRWLEGFDLKQQCDYWCGSTATPRDYGTELLITKDILSRQYTLRLQDGTVLGVYNTLIEAKFAAEMLL